MHSTIIPWALLAAAPLASARFNLLPLRARADDCCPCPKPGEGTTVTVTQAAPSSSPVTVIVTSVAPAEPTTVTVTQTAPAQHSTITKVVTVQPEPAASQQPVTVSIRPQPDQPAPQPAQASNKEPVTISIRPKPNQPQSQAPPESKQPVTVSIRPQPNQPESQQPASSNKQPVTVSIRPKPNQPESQQPAGSDKQPVTISIRPQQSEEPQQPQRIVVTKTVTAPQQPQEPETVTVTAGGSSPAPANNSPVTITVRPVPAESPSRPDEPETVTKTVGNSSGEQSKQPVTISIRPDNVTKTMPAVTMTAPPEMSTIWKSATEYRTMTRTVGSGHDDVEIIIINIFTGESVCQKKDSGKPCHHKPPVMSNPTSPCPSIKNMTSTATAFNTVMVTVSSLPSQNATSIMGTAPPSSEAAQPSGNQPVSVLIRPAPVRKSL